MNKKIEEIAKSAGAIEFGGKNCLFGNNDIELFATKIIWECAKLAEEHSAIYTGEHKEGDGCRGSAHAILAGFGLKR